MGDELTMSEDIDNNIKNILLDGKLPPCFIETYKTALVLGLLLEPIAAGENMSNISYQLNRLFKSYGIDTMDFNERLAELLKKYSTLAETTTKKDPI